MQSSNLRGGVEEKRLVRLVTVGFVLVTAPARAATVTPAAARPARVATPRTMQRKRKKRVHSQSPRRAGALYPGAGEPLCNAMPWTRVE